jgi:hypothetical protein
MSEIKAPDETQLWDEFAEATENLSVIYPDIKKTDVWRMLVNLDLILEGTN